MSSPEGQGYSAASPKPQRAVLLAIGDEVLRGEIANTNGTFIADRLFEAGFSVVEHAVVSDEPAEIRGALVRLRATADVIVATGGLGPTEDDRTVDVVADIFGTGTVPDEPSLGAMKKRFSTHGFELTPNNLRQVRIPVGAKALPNSAGIAPGFVVRLGGADAYFLPGVPREMERMFLDQVAPRLSVRMAEAGVPRAAVRTWHVYGMGESHIDHRLAGLLNGVESGVVATLHFRTSHPVNHVKVVVRGKSVEEEQATLERIDAELRKRIGPGIYAVDGDSFPAAVAKSLRAQDPPATLAIAESCTGGLELLPRQHRGLLRRREDQRARRQAGDARRLRRRQRAVRARDGRGRQARLRVVRRGGHHGRRGAGRRLARQAGGHGLLRRVRPGHDAHVHQALRRQPRARARRGGLLRARSRAPLLRHAQALAK